MKLPSSVAGVVEVERFETSAPSPHWLLIEVPHGATRRADYDAVASQMKSKLPAQLEHFFFVNTDVGAPEGAKWLGRTLSAQGVNVVVTRCLIPRTFIDTNRVVGALKPGQVSEGLTAAIAAYITDAADVPVLSDLHARYHQVVDAAYQEVCRGANGLALQLHSYAPKSVGIEKVDHTIVEQLHRAYEPGPYATWPERPSIDLICATKDGSFKAAPKLVEAAVRAWREAGVQATENGTYHLHPVTMGMQYAQAYPYQVVCVELNRGLIGDPFTPFAETKISDEKVGGLLRPLAAVLRSALIS
ncbi:MAG: N-formylglutamate amidohydrolase [Myxococcaceae bacterium]